MIGLKLWGLHGASFLIVGMVVAAFVLAGSTELVRAEGRATWVVIYVLILGAECLIITLASVWLFEERYTVREMIAGAVTDPGWARRSPGRDAPGRSHDCVGTVSIL